MPTIQLKRSATTGHVPASLAAGEVAINEADSKLFYRNPLGTVVNFALGLINTGSGLVAFTKTAGFGYGIPGAGDGGAVVQATNKSTGVVLNNELDNVFRRWYPQFRPLAA